MKPLLATAVVAGLALAGLIAAAPDLLPPGPTAVYLSTFDVADPPPNFQIISIVLDFEPGSWTPMHTHGGPGIVTVLEGTVTRRNLEGEEHSFGPGDTWLETGEVEAAGNDTESTARVVFTLMLPEGEDVTIPYQE
ncbi:MAG: cupin domain-containing protein [Trueperaceae bacterium]